MRPSHSSFPRPATRGEDAAPRSGEAGEGQIKHAESLIQSECRREAEAGAFHLSPQGRGDENCEPNPIFKTKMTACNTP
jgi:hypothetical protein